MATDLAENGHMDTDSSNPANEDDILAVGVIYPPPEIRAIADKAAEYFAKNGPGFEDRIREHEKHNPKFSFLNSNDPYRAYYEHKIREWQTKKDLPEAKEDGIRLETARKPIVDEEVKLPPPEPPRFEFMADPPPISAQDLDIVKLTAQFVARNGRQFMASLASREQKNYQFDFLRPNHSVFPYFTKLVDQYTKVLLPAKETMRSLRENFENEPAVLKRIMQRVEFTTWMDEQKKRAEAEADQERIAYALIDWHDFVVVDTIEFVDSDEMMDLPPPMSLNHLENMTLAQRKANLILNEETFQEDGGDMEMDVEEEPVKPAPKPSVVTLPPPSASTMLPPSAAPPPPMPFSATTTPSSKPDSSLKIVSNYVPKAASKTAATSEATQICPRCGQAIPISEMDEHVRIELLDPKWREQRQRAAAKQGESNLNMGIDVAKNLAKLSDYRTDIFGVEETDIGRKIIEDQQKAAEKERVVWDGHSGSVPLATKAMLGSQTIEDQIAARQRYQQQIMEEANKIGPQITPAGQQAPIPPTAFGIQPPPASALGASSTPVAPQTGGPSTLPRPPAFGAPPALPLPGAAVPIAASIGMPSAAPPPPLPAGAARPSSPAFGAPPPLPGPPLPPNLTRPLPPPPSGSIIPPPMSKPAAGPEGRTESEAKRQKVDNDFATLPGYVSEDEWMKEYPGNFTVTVQPQEGDAFALDDLSQNMLCSAIMEKIKGVTSVAPSKQKLVVRGSTVLLGKYKIAVYNLKDGDCISMSVRGKK
ncbi:hypothetical protein SeMB42_g06392 [Synchytrium endobioticum]|uniref:SURP motif domain-containing protein n=1 Tax=Synchytrium endobioticum TaxID=286115 RepID=A0A507DGP3_9FUNG|nr:hypothetical protein SeMB42_g06392 [Synchytrium endobioticum]TPX50842.1 hypothetical protein SeLEV6574_g00647 [Synchytrium endobioticum]